MVQKVKPEAFSPKRNRMVNFMLFGLINAVVQSVVCILCDFSVSGEEQKHPTEAPTGILKLFTLGRYFVFQKSVVLFIFCDIFVRRHPIVLILADTYLKELFAACQRLLTCQKLAVSLSMGAQLCRSAD